MTGDGSAANARRRRLGNGGAEEPVRRLGGRRLGGGGGLATAAPRSQLGVYLSFSLSFSLSRGLSVLIRGHIQDLCGQSFMHKNVQSVLALRLNPHPQGLALFSTHAVRSRSAQFPAAPAPAQASTAAAPWLGGFAYHSVYPSAYPCLSPVISIISLWMMYLCRSSWFLSFCSTAAPRSQFGVLHFFPKVLKFPHSLSHSLSELIGEPLHHAPF